MMQGIRKSGIINGNMHGYTAALILPKGLKLNETEGTYAGDYLYYEIVL